MEGICLCVYTTRVDVCAKPSACVEATGPRWVFSSDTFQIGFEIESLSDPHCFVKTS